MEESKIQPWLAKEVEKEFGFDSLLPVQKEVIPMVCRALDSQLPVDVCLSAPTGSGKTFCYLLPIIQHIKMLRSQYRHGRQLYCVILVPSKELGKQVLHIAKKLMSSSGLEVAPLLGGMDDAGLVKTVPLPDGTTATFAEAELVVATPQRLLKHITKERSISLGHLKMLIIDEADEVLSGSVTTFASKVVAHYESQKPKGATLHKMLCSATMTTHIAKVSELGLQNPIYYTLDNLARPVQEQTVTHKFTMPVRLHEHWLAVNEGAHRHVVFLRLVRHLIRKHEADEGSASSALLIFCSSNESVRTIGHFLAAAGITTLEFTSATSDVERKKAILEAFIGASTSIVVATDALMRGIDMPGVGSVVMYDAPRSLQQYIHRTGRTARANQVGHSYCLLTRTGPSGTKEDGEITSFKHFNAHLSRTNPAVHERQLQAISEDDIAEATDLLNAASGKGRDGKKRNTNKKHTKEGLLGTSSSATAAGGESEDGDRSEDAAGVSDDGSESTSSTIQASRGKRSRHSTEDGQHEEEELLGLL